jgi:hypothetical protein
MSKSQMHSAFSVRLRQLLILAADLLVGSIKRHLDMGCN